LWIQEATGGTFHLGFTTASGATFSADYSTAAPVGVSAVAVDPSGSGRPVDVLVSSRLVSVYTVVNCTLKVVNNPQGQPYQFGMGFTDVGTGMGCSTVGGETGLVGLDAEQNADGSYTITRTAVEQNGEVATNGPTDTVAAAAGSAALTSAQGQVSCGDVTLADGVGISD
jgi:hypothetical protein